MIKPFSNATEAMNWQEHNCFQCSLYECDSKKEEDAGCVPAFYLDLGYITGDMPEQYAEQVGVMGGMKCKLKVDK